MLYHFNCIYFSLQLPFLIYINSNICSRPTGTSFSKKCMVLFWPKYIGVCVICSFTQRNFKSTARKSPVAKKNLSGIIIPVNFTCDNEQLRKVCGTCGRPLHSLWCTRIYNKVALFYVFFNNAWHWKPRVAAKRARIMLSRGSLRVSRRGTQARWNIGVVLVTMRGVAPRASSGQPMVRLARRRWHARCISHVRGLPPLHRDKSLCSLACLRPPRWSTFAQTKRDILRRDCENT